MRRLTSVLGGILLALCAQGRPAHAAPPDDGTRPKVRVLATTTTHDTGLLEAVVQAFEQHSGYAVTTSVAGSEAALRMAARGAGDVVWTHSPAAEQQYQQAGYWSSRRPVMYDSFIIAGPSADPAAIRDLSADEALRQIAAQGAQFISRGDGSGTQVRELQLWKLVGIDPHGKSWYSESKVGQGATALLASNAGAYVLTDNATFTVLAGRLNLVPLVQRDPRLLNIYHVMVVSSAKVSGANEAAGRAFADFLVSPAGQEVIRRFGEGQSTEPLFTAAGDADEASLNAAIASLPAPDLTPIAASAASVACAAPRSAASAQP